MYIWAGALERERRREKREEKRELSFLDSFAVGVCGVVYTTFLLCCWCSVVAYAVHIYIYMYIYSVVQSSFAMGVCGV